MKENPTRGTVKRDPATGEVTLTERGKRRVNAVNKMKKDPNYARKLMGLPPL